MQAEMFFFAQRILYEYNACNVGSLSITHNACGCYRYSAQEPVTMHKVSLPYAIELKGLHVSTMKSNGICNQ